MPTFTEYIRTTLSSSCPPDDINIEQPQTTTLQFDPFPPPKNMSIFPANYSQGVSTPCRVGMC